MKAATFCVFLFWSTSGLAQISTAGSNRILHEAHAEKSNHDSNIKFPVDPPVQRKNKVLLIAGVHGFAYTSTLLLLSEAWYKDFPKSSFHTFNDSKEWLQMDKAGHAWTSYNIAVYSRGLWSWAGLKDDGAVVLGGLSSVGYQTILEYLDGHSSGWGWSWTDMGANIAGATAYVAQELAWKEQKARIKFSSHPVSYRQDLIGRADTLFGASVPERVLKDYNGQTYWLSVNVRAVTGESNVPGWLNAAIGYGVKGVLGGFSNTGYSKSGELVFYRPDIKRQRQWYLSPDIDFTKIKTGKKGFKTLFYLLNMIKLPAPALELSGGKLKAHLVYF